MDPETQNLIERREDELTLVLLEEGLSLEDFNRSLEINPEGIIEWIRFSLTIQH